MTITLASVDTIFPIHLYRYRVEEPGLNAILAAEIEQRRKSEQGMKNQKNRVGWQSERDLFQRPEQGHARLARALAQIVRETVLSLDPSADFNKLQVLMNGWLNVNPPGGYNSPHQHSDAHLSGVYYVDVPKSPSAQGGAIEFLSPHPVRLVGSAIKSAQFSDRVRIQPKAGDVIVFPGSLVHWVHPNDSGKPRVTVAFNATIRERR